MNRIGSTASALLRGFFFMIAFACAGTAAAQAWTQLSPTGGPPGAREYLGSGAFSSINNRLIVFGGYNGSCGLNDTWVLSNADGSGGTPNWTLLEPTGGPPAAREGHMTAYNPNSNTLVTFGAWNCGDLLGDVWTLSHADGTGGTPVWTQLSPGEGPDARGFATTVYAPASNSLILFGGYDFSVLGDVWVLSHADGNGGTPAWTQLSPTGPGPSLAEHSAVYDAGSNSMIVFGGLDGGFNYHNEVWVLSHADGTGGTPAWTQLAPTGTVPTPRILHTSVFDPAGGNMIIFGGTDNVSGDVNDVWVLSHANGSGGTPAWTQLSPTGTIPQAREGHVAGYNVASNSMVVFGGSILNDTWVLSDASPTTTIPVTIDIRPRTAVNTISLAHGTDIPVTILSSASFDATTQVDQTSLTFGHAGTEASFISCNVRATDVNGDGYMDLTCHFNGTHAGFVLGDTTGYLQGKTTVKNSISGSDSVLITQ